MVSCEEVLEALESWLDDELATQARGELEAHLAHCRTCRVLYDTTRRTLRIVTDSASFELPAELSERLRRKIMDRIPYES